MRELTAMSDEHPWEKIHREGKWDLKEPFPRFGEVVEAFKKHDFRSVLDLGCGSGRHVVALGEAGIAVTGLDISPSGLAATREWVDERTEWAPARLVQADMRDGLPFRNGAFDGIMSFQVIHHAMLAEVLGTIDEIWRILKPGGIVVVSVAGRIHDDEEYEEVEQGTYLPKTGWEAGVPHVIFDEERLRQAFSEFQVDFVERRAEGRVVMVQAQKW